VRPKKQTALCYTPQLEVSDMEPRFFDELNKKVSELLAASPARDIEKNVRALLSSAFSRLDLVTREEFDVQAEVLSRTREKLQQMEARVAALEAGVPTDQAKGGRQDA
jgi:BMFP domain-containing protein YqiC